MRTTAILLALGALGGCSTVEYVPEVTPAQVAAMDCEQLLAAGLAARDVIERNQIEMGQPIPSAQDLFMPATRDLGRMANGRATQQIRAYRTSYEAKGCELGPGGTVPF